MTIYDRINGGALEWGNTDKWASRLARMRVRVWWGVQGLLALQKMDGGEMHMLTLTYTGVDDWRPDHISMAMQWARRHGVRAYVWVAELQDRGAVHYHVLVLWPAGRPWIKPTDGNGWGKGFTWVTVDVRFPYYVMKYIQKGGDLNGKQFPKGLRLYGVSQYALRVLPFEERIRERASMLPRWFGTDSETDSRYLDARRVVGGVDFGGSRAYSPYTRDDLADIDTVASEMYAMAWSLGITSAL